MAIVDACPHCGYAVPDQSSTCPGCTRHRRYSPHGGSPRRIISVVPDLAPSPGTHGRRYCSLLESAQLARRMLGVSGAVALCLAGGLLARFALSLDHVAKRVPTATYADAAQLTRALAIATLASVAVTGIAFVAWLVRAYRNLPSLGIADRRYWTSWLVIGWVVPLANLFVPKLVVDDLWRASSPNLPAYPGPGWQQRPVSSLVNRWWGMWTAAPAIAYLGYSVIDGPIGGLRVQQAADVAGCIAAILLVGAGRAAHSLVGIVTVSQAQRAEVVAADVARVGEMTSDGALALAVSQ